MKKFLLLLVAMILATAARAAVGDTFTYQGLNFKVLSETDRTVAVALNENASGDITIPSYVVKGSSRYIVTEIGEDAFRGHVSSDSRLVSVTIPNSVHTIGLYAFAFQSNLTSVSIPNSVNIIGYSAFRYCSSLPSVNIPNSVSTIEDYAFEGCSCLTSVSIPYSVTTIGFAAFHSCRSLTSVNISNSVTTIGSGAFSNCESLISVSIPSSATTIGSGVFSGCSKLIEISVENGNPNYTSENGVLFNVDKTTLVEYPGGKKGGYSIPQSVTTITYMAFNDCRSLTSVSIPSSVITIEGSAFSECTGLTSVYIPSSVTTIEEGAFSGCSSLASVFISNSVTTIENSTFSKCTNLASVYIPNSVTTIRPYAFYGCSSLTSVYIPNSVTALNQYSFADCSSLTSISIPVLVTTIGRGAFSGCENLKTIYDLNPTPQTIVTDAFKDVPANAVIYIPKGSFYKYLVADGWAQFSDFREMGKLEITLGGHNLQLAVGETATINVIVTKDDDVTINSETWTSSNPDVVTVDNSMVTAISPGDAVIYFTLVDGYGLARTEECRVTVSKQSGINSVHTDTDAPVDVCTLQGVTVLHNAAPDELNTLPAGIYIVRQGTDVRKIAVR